MSTQQRRISLSTGLLIALVLSLAWAQPVAANIPTVQIHVHYDAGWGNSLSIRGSSASLNWASGKPMTWTSGNVWVWDVPPTAISGFEFKVLINDVGWSTGGNYKVAEASPRFIHIYPFFGPARGRMVTIANFFSPQLNNRRTVILYLPPSYNENSAKRYPVVYMHDGQNLFNAQTAFGGVEWQVDETLNRLIGQGTAREAIVVGVYNTAGRISEYTPSVDPNYGGGNANAYLDFVQQTLKPYIDRDYRTLSAKPDTLMIGSSLGGLLSCYAGWTRSITFGAVGCLSSSFWWNGEEFTRTVGADQGKRAERFYIDSGGIADGLAETSHFVDTLLANGYVNGVDLLRVYDPTGSHNESSWARRLPTSLEYLLPAAAEIHTN